VPKFQKIIRPKKETKNALNEAMAQFFLWIIPILGAKEDKQFYI